MSNIDLGDDPDGDIAGDDTGRSLKAVARLPEEQLNEIARGVVSGSDLFAGREQFGALIRQAAAAATYDEAITPDFKRLNNIAVCERFMDMLTARGCMITRIPRSKK